MIKIREGFDRAMKISKSDFGIVEGVRGLYEGISPLEDVGSTASIAKALDAPVILNFKLKKSCKKCSSNCNRI